MSHELCCQCGGEGQRGMHRDGQPIVCTHCDGTGFEPDHLAERVDAASDWARDSAVEPPAEEVYGSDDCYPMGLA